MPTLEERFWANVWQCTHRRPCQACCWPYGRQVDYQDALTCYSRFTKYGLFLDKDIGHGVPAHRMAYSLSRGGIGILPGRSFAVCHRCNYGYCCNPPHLSLGAQADNGRDKRGMRYGNDPETAVLFPDGRRIVRVHPHAGRPSLPRQRLTRLGKEIEKARIECDLTRRFLAARAGVSEAYFVAIEEGKVDPSWSIMVKLSIALEPYLMLDRVAWDTHREEKGLLEQDVRHDA